MFTLLLSVSHTGEVLIYQSLLLVLVQMYNHQHIFLIVSLERQSTKLCKELLYFNFI